MELRNKVVIVTGASRGLGKAIAASLVDRGANVFGLARSADQLHELRSELGEGFHPVECDVREEPQVRKAVEVVLRDGGRIDALVNNAGLGIYGPVEALGVEEWDVQIETNLRGVFLCTQAVLPPMKEQNRESGFGGHIVNVASIAGLIGTPRLAAYNASKYGLRGFSDALMKEVRDDGIKVTCLYPGSIETSFSASSGSRGATHKMQPEDVASTVIHVLEAPENYLISEVVMRPLRPRG